MTNPIVQVLPSLAESTGTHSLQSVAFASPVTTGNTIVVFINIVESTGSYSSIQDTQGNTYTQDETAQANSVSPFVRVYRSSNVTGGAGFKITANLNGTGGGPQCVFTAVELQNLAASPLDAAHNHNSNASATTTPTTGATGTRAQADEIVFVLLGLGAGTATTFTEPSGFTSIAQEPTSNFLGFDVAYQITSNITSINAQWTIAPAQAFGAIIVPYEFKHDPLGPIMPGWGAGGPNRFALRAPWNKLITPPWNLVQLPPPPTPSAPVPPYTGGPVKGPWQKFGQPGIPGPPAPPPPGPPPPTPTAGHNLPFIPRVPDIHGPYSEDRLRRFTEAVSSVLNSLIAQGLIVSTGPLKWNISGIGVASFDGRTGLVTLTPADIAVAYPGVGATQVLAGPGPAFRNLTVNDLPFAPQALGAAATDLPSVIILANNIRTALINLGLCTP